MKSQLFIPSKIKVGYQKRDDTYTKRLAYVVYYDLKGNLRKEKSWKGWIEPKLGTPDFDNKPAEGFVLNKDVGGTRHSYGSWNQRMEKVRVYDPRGFEFEINIPNLLYILQECTSSKGKGLEGEFIYAWDGPELILLPVASQEYKDCAAFTGIQGNKVGIKDMIAGHVYMTKKQESVIYMGKFPWTVSKYKRSNGYKTTVETKPMHIFWNEKDKVFFADSGFTKIAAKTGDLVSDYATRMDKLEADPHMSIPVGLELRPKTFTESGSGYNAQLNNGRNNTGYLKVGNEYHSYQFSNDYDYNSGKPVHRGWRPYRQNKISLVGGKIESEYSYDHSSTPRIKSVKEINEVGYQELYVVMKNGKKIRFDNYNIH